MLNEKIRIKLKAYDHRVLDQSTSRDRRNGKENGSKDRRADTPSDHQE